MPSNQLDRHVSELNRKVFFGIAEADYLWLLFFGLKDLLQEETINPDNHAKQLTDRQCLVN